MVVGWSDGRLKRNKTMTYTNLSQLAASIFAAIAVSTLFVSAAVAPAAQFI